MLFTTARWYTKKSNAIYDTGVVPLYYNTGVVHKLRATFAADTSDRPASTIAVLPLCAVGL